MPTFHPPGALRPSKRLWRFWRPRPGAARLIICVRLSSVGSTRWRTTTSAADVLGARPQGRGAGVFAGRSRARPWPGGIETDRDGRQAAIEAVQAAQAGRITQFLRETCRLGTHEASAGSLPGRSADFRRYRVGDDRVICDIKDGSHARSGRESRRARRRLSLISFHLETPPTTLPYVPWVTACSRA